jgi:hypothetical protein
MIIANVTDERSATSTVCRISADGAAWRVAVESWPAPTGREGRFVFAPDGRYALERPRVGPTLLAGRTHEDIVAAAHELPDDRLRALLHSLF